MSKLISDFIIAIVLTFISRPILRKIFRQDWRRVVLIQMIGYFLLIYPPKSISAYLYDWITGNEYPPKWIVTLEHSLFVVLLVIVPAVYAEIEKINRRWISTLLLVVPLGIILVTWIVLMKMKYIN